MRPSDSAHGVFEDVLIWAWIATGGLAAAVWLLAALTWPRGRSCRCKGPKPATRWRALLPSWHWIRRGRCWYDLSGHAGSNTRCPECGTPSPTLLRDGRRLRTGRIAVPMTVLAITALILGPIRMGTWPRAIPTLPLAMLSDTSVGEHGTPLRKEMQQRVEDGEVSGFSARMLAQSIVADLRDDDTRWNARSAAKMLRSLMPHAHPVLERELIIGDQQSWRAAASILRRSGVSPPSESLINACVAELHDDRYNNANSAAAYLAKWSHSAPQHIRQAILSDDPQQRFLASAVAGYSGDAAAMDTAVPILISHLRDNNVSNDGQVAAGAIYRFGPGVLPLLRQYANDEDYQARTAVRHIIERLEHPDRAWFDCVNGMPPITDKTHDPLEQSISRALYY